MRSGNCKEERCFPLESSRGEPFTQIITLNALVSLPKCLDVPLLRQVHRGPGLFQEFPGWRELQKEQLLSSQCESKGPCGGLRSTYGAATGTPQT